MRQKLYGFTILRNGIKYDYPFRESLRSLCALCDKVYLALGRSDDGTEQQLEEFENLVIIPTVWDESLRKSGLILSVQTNIALEALRRDHKEGWAVYLQADEVLSERDFARIRADVDLADREGCDAISFRYLHFWQSYHAIAVDWRWYPQEVRAIKLDSPAASSGDAQGFSGLRKRFESDALVYHYGHVREPSAYERKKADFGRWWHGDDELKKVLRKGARRDRHETVIPFFGPHPSFMKERIGDPPVAMGRVLVFGRPEDYPGWEGRVDVEIEWTLDPVRLLRSGEKFVALARPPLWSRIFPSFRSRVPSRMGSPHAREWDKDFVVMLKFSEKGIPSR
jgi:hypothetical protein